MILLGIPEWNNGRTKGKFFLFFPCPTSAVSKLCIQAVPSFVSNPTFAAKQEWICFISQKLVWLIVSQYPVPVFFFFHFKRNLQLVINQDRLSCPLPTTCSNWKSFITAKNNLVISIHYYCVYFFPLSHSLNDMYEQ